MVTLKHKKKETLENVIRIRGRGDLLICIIGYLQGYLRGIIEEHKAIKWACRAASMMIVFAVAFVVVSFVPNVWKFPKDSETTIVSVAQAAEEETGTDMLEETEENADKLEGLDDPLMAPTDQSTRCRIGTVSGLPLTYNIAIKGTDMTPPQITGLTVDDYEISKVDQMVPVTVTIEAIDEVTPTRQLEYAFLPEGVDIQEAEWMKEASFTAEIDQNGFWIAYVKDESGNIALKEHNFVVVDNKAPEIELHLENLNDWCKENQIYVSAEDALPVQYRYLCEETGEDSGWIDGSSKSIRENGTWKIQVQDSIGNITEQSITIENIDTEPPVICSIKEKTEKESISNEE